MRIGGFHLQGFRNMHTEDLSRWTHTHDFNSHGQEQKKAERGTRLVLALTVAAMLLEIGAGWWTGWS